jgi:hypothetical protein
MDIGQKKAKLKLLMKNKKAIIVLREPEASETEHILKAVGDESIDLYSVEEFAALFADKASIIELSAKQKSQINYDVLNKLLAFGDKRIDGKSVSQHLSFAKHASIWYYHKFRIYFLIRNKHYDLSLITALQKEYDNLVVYSNNNLGLYLDGHVDIINPRRKVKKDYLSMFYYALFLVSRIVIGVFSKSVRSAKYLLLDRGSLQPMLMPDLSIRPGNYNLEYLFQKANSQFAIMHEVDLPKFNGENRFKIKQSVFKNRNSQTGFISAEKVLVHGILNTRIRKKALMQAKLLKGKFDELEQSFAASIERDIISELSKLHQTNKYYIFRYYSFKRFFRKYGFKSVSSIDENSPLVKTILDAAKDCGIKTIGIQHGAIHKLHPAYRFTHIDHLNKATTDKTILWGEYWKELLIDVGGLSEQSLEISGQIRSDIIPLLQDSNQQIFDGSKRNIVFASQPQRDANIRYRAAEDVFRAITSLGNEYWLHLKLHPNEMSDKGYYGNIAKKAGCNNYSFIGNQDLYQVISACDVLITCFSTVGTETIYFKKPLVILDHLEQDVQGYISQGVAFQATCQQELENYIGGICGGNLKIDEKSYDNFIKKYAYIIDGKTCERVIRIISDQPPE